MVFRETSFLFIKGLKDSLQIPSSLIHIISDHELSQKVFMCMLINGLVYLGSVLFYNYFLLNIFTSNSDLNQANLLTMVLSYIMTIFYHFWILVIYIIALTLNTFWVQDIFDILLVKELIRKFEDKKVAKNPGKYLKVLQEADV